MATQISLFLIVVFAVQRFAPERARELIVWNVGQGQWLTLLDDSGCEHFDMGGERAPWKALMRACREVPNRVSLSHWDWDHVSFVGRAASYLPELCVQVRPGGVGSERKQRLLRRLRDCPKGPPEYFVWQSPHKAPANAASNVIYHQGIVIPGDSRRSEEKIWRHEIPGLADARILILGHHGSQTSTSKELLKTFKRLRVAVASSRTRRYGHPHKSVVRALFDRKVPLLTTEDWGNIHFAL